MTLITFTFMIIVRIYIILYTKIITLILNIFVYCTVHGLMGHRPNMSIESIQQATKNASAKP